MRKAIVFFLFVVCAVPAYSQTGLAIIHFYGDGYYGARHVPLYIDGKEVASMHGRQVIDVRVTPGRHEIRSADKRSGIALDAKDAGESFVKVTLGGNFILHGQVTLVDPAQGQYEVQARSKP